MMCFTALFGEEPDTFLVVQPADSSFIFSAPETAYLRKAYSFE
jgi:hypothetical protein